MSITFCQRVGDAEGAFDALWRGFVRHELSQR
jgi:hypothetical protein